MCKLGSCRDTTFVFWTSSPAKSVWEPPDRVNSTSPCVRPPVRPTHTHTHTTYHPDFGGVGHSAVQLEHPAVVGEEQLEAEAQCEDEREPEQGAEEQRRQHGLTLGTQSRMETGRERESGREKETQES